jgi:hypothetical protein
MSLAMTTHDATPFRPEQDHDVDRSDRTGARSAAEPPSLRSRIAEDRTSWLTIAIVVALAGAGVFGVVGLLGFADGKHRPPGSASGTPAAVVGGGAPTGTQAPPTPASVTLSATGDIILGSAPGQLPPAGGRDFFNAVRDQLRADVVMGNLEEPLTDDTGVVKCPAPSPAPGGGPPVRTSCFAFWAPPSYAALLAGAGFGVLNLANNHAYDFGAAGNRQTRTALDAAGVRHTGAAGQVTVVEANGVRVAVLGFSPYSYSPSVLDLTAAAKLVEIAKSQADLVVVQMHVGAEGADRTHVRPGTENFLGENRGDPIAFAHAVIDAGADLVVGHGPHVMRGMEFYKDRLVAYSLGNFAGYRTLAYNGVTGVGGVLKVTMAKDGSYLRGSLVPTRMVAPGLPAPDPAKAALSLVRQLSQEDLPGSAVRVGDDGALTAPST